MKEEIIKKLVENQNTVLNTTSAKPNTQHSDILNQSSSSRPSNKLNENSRNTKQLTSQGPQDPLVARQVDLVVVFITTAKNISSHSSTPPKT